MTFIGYLSLLSMSMIIAARVCSEELASGLLNATTFPMLLLSEAWFSLDKTPEWLQTLSQFMPLTHIIGSARRIMIDGATLYDLIVPMGILSGITVVCLLIAAKLFRWS